MVPSASSSPAPWACVSTSKMASSTPFLAGAVYRIFAAPGSQIGVGRHRSTLATTVPALPDPPTRIRHGTEVATGIPSQNRGSVAAGMYDRIVKPAPVDLRALWPGEAADFTPWLADNLDWLEPLGIGPLELIEVEARLPGIGRSLDILAQTSDGHRVAIENQYATVDHDHLTRGLAYAVGHQATALVVIAEHHRPEFVAVADYLNDASEALGHEDGIAVFLVGLTVDGIADRFVPRFEVLSRPNEWMAAARRTEQGFLGSVDAFLAACDTEVIDSWREMLTGWERRPGATVGTRAKQSVALYLRDPDAGDRRRAILALYVTGEVTIYRGYIADSGLFGEEPHELDALINELFPNARWGEKRYYLTDQRCSPELLNRFADEVQRRIGHPQNNSSST